MAEKKRKDPWRLPDSSARFEPIAEQGNDNFATSIYEADYKGLLIARCNQNGAYPHHVTAILNGLNGKQVSAELIAKQAAEIEALRANHPAKTEAVESFHGSTRKCSLSIKPFSTYPEDHSKLLGLAAAIEGSDAGSQEFEDAADKLADLVKAILTDEETWLEKDDGPTTA